MNIIYTDISKAFDTVDHNILGVILHRLGFRNPINSLLVSFISNRKKYVKYKKFCSNYFNVTLGVLQR